MDLNHAWTKQLGHLFKNLDKYKEDYLFFQEHAMKGSAAVIANMEKNW